MLICSTGTIAVSHARSYAPRDGKPATFFTDFQQHVVLLFIIVINPRYRLVCTGVPPPKVCPCGDLTGSGRDLAWFSGV